MSSDALLDELSLWTCQAEGRKRDSELTLRLRDLPGLVPFQVSTVVDVAYLDRNARRSRIGSRSYPSVRAFNNSLFISSLPKISISPLAKKNGINTTNMSSMVAKTSLGSAAVSEKLAAKD